MIPNTMRKDAQRQIQVSRSSERKKKKKNEEKNNTTSASIKKTLPVRPFLTSRGISARASSTSARTSVDICAVASLTSSPIDGSADSACGSVNGMLVSVRGTPSLRSVFVRSDLLTDGPPERMIVRFMLPCSPMSDEATEHCQPFEDRRWGALITLDWRGRSMVNVHFLLTGVSLCRAGAVGCLGSRRLW